MKKIGISILSLMLICCFCFVGCSSANILPVQDVERVNYTQATTLVLGDGVSLADSANNVTDHGNILVKKVINEKTHYGVFSVLENKLVFDFVENYITIESSEYSDYVILTTSDTYKIVSLSGEVLFEGVSDYELESVKFEKYAYESWTIIGSDQSKVVYLDRIKLKNGKRSEVFEYPLVKQGYVLNTSTTIKPAVLEFGMEAEDYMFDSASLSNGDTQITMYSKKGKIKSQYTISSENMVNVTELGHESLVQYVKLLDSMSEKYDFIVDGEKYDLITYRINMITGKMKEVDCNCILVYSIYDYRLDYAFTMCLDVMGKNFAESDLPSLARTGKVYINGDVSTLDYMYTSDVKRLAEDRYLAETEDGETHIIDSEFNLIINLGEVDDVMATSERLFVVKGQDINLIDFDGVLKSGTPAYQPKEYVGVVNDCLLVYDTPGHVNNREWKTIDEQGIVKVVATLIDGEYKYGNEVVENIVASELGFLVQSASQVAGNSVYRLYGFDGVLAGTWDVPTLTGNIEEISFGGEYGNTHCLIEVDDVLVLLF